MTWYQRLWLSVLVGMLVIGTLAHLTRPSCPAGWMLTGVAGVSSDPDVRTIDLVEGTRPVLNWRCLRVRDRAVELAPVELMWR